MTMTGAEIDALIDERIVKMRNFIDVSFRDIPALGWDANILRVCAHNALDMLIAGDTISATIAIQQLDPKGAIEFRRKLIEFDFLPHEEEQF